MNAGISATGKFEDIPAAHYRRLMTVNAETPMVLATALIRAGAVRRTDRVHFMIEKGRG